MNLKEYLFYMNMTIVEFSRIADLSAPYISQIISGKKTPSAKTCRTIERATFKMVKADRVNCPMRQPNF